MLDGFPRTAAQADALEARLAQRGGSVRVAVYIDVPSKVLVERLAGRWMCRVCQASFHTLYNPPITHGLCDVCEGELYQRSDDARDVVANRIAVYMRDTQPLVEHYERQGILRQIDGNQSIDAVRTALLRAVADSEAVAA